MPAELIVVLTRDYYAQLSQIRLTPNFSAGQAPEPGTEIILDDSDVGHLVASRAAASLAPYAPIIRPGRDLRTSPGSVPRRSLRFGLAAPPAFEEIRKIVAEELKTVSTTTPSEPATAPLLPRMPVPAHLRKPPAD